MTGALDFLKERLAELDEHGLAIHPRELEGPTGARARFDGRDVINLASNNYLGLANHPRMNAAASKAAAQFGAGSGAVRTIAGTMSMHRELERRFADFKHAEGALMFQSGFTANAGTVAAVLDKEDVIVSDRLNHASMIDGAHASGVLGKGGAGTVDHFGVHGRVDIQVGTLSKAIGVLGGFIAGPN